MSNQIKAKIDLLVGEIEAVNQGQRDILKMLKMGANDNILNSASSSDFVCFCIPSFVADRGDFKKVIIRLSSKLSQHGIKTTVVWWYEGTNHKFKFSYI